MKQFQTRERLHNNNNKKENFKAVNLVYFFKGIFVQKKKGLKYETTRIRIQCDTTLRKNKTTNKNKTKNCIMKNFETAKEIHHFFDENYFRLNLFLFFRITVLIMSKKLLFRLLNTRNLKKIK